MDWFSRFMKNGLAPTLLLAIKVLTAVRSGLDTLIVTGMFAPETSMLIFLNGVLYVLLIDLIFIGLWRFAAYGGESQRATVLRAYSIVGAWLLYIGMLIVGWNAHPEAPFLALLGRVAGGVALGYDTGGILFPAIRGIYRQLFHKRTAKDVYAATIDQEMIQAIRDSRGTIRVQTREIIGQRIPLELRDIVYGLLPVPEDVVGEADEDGSAYVGKSKTNTAIQAAWESCRQNLEPNHTFTRGDIEQCTSLGRSRIGDLLAYAASLGDVVKVRHGLYLYQPRPVDVTPTFAEDVPTNDSANEPDF